MTNISPKSETELAELIQSCVNNGKKIRVQGASKSVPLVIAAEDIALDMRHFSNIISIDKDRKKVTVGPGMLIEDLCARLWDEGFSLCGLGSVAGQTIGGLISCGSHGFGLHMGNFSSNVSRIRMMDGLGQMRIFSKDEDKTLFNAIPVSMGCLGVFTEVELSLVARHHLLRSVQVVDYQKNRNRPIDIITQSCAMVRMRPELGLAIALTLKPTSLTPLESADVFRNYEGHFQYIPSTHPDLKAKGMKKWKLRFRNLPTRLRNRVTSQQPTMIPSNTGFAIPLDNVPKAITLLDRFMMSNYPRMRGSYQFRGTKADELWMSQSFGVDVCHVTYYIKSAINPVHYQQQAETLLTDLGARPHWGKLHTLATYDFPMLFPKWEQFKALKKELDPHDVFANGWTRELFSK